MHTIQTEKFVDYIEELKPILETHWDMLALNKDQVPLDPQYEIYEKRDELGELLSVIMRDEDGKISGYFIGFIAPGLHYKTCLTCTMDIFFVRPEYRSGSAAIRLFRFVEREIKALGVDRWFVGSKLHSPVDRLFASLGFDQVETYYSKYLGD